MALLNILKQYSSVHEVPEYVKESFLFDKENLGGLKPADFADAKREFPAHTKAATWLSHLKYLTDEEKYADTAVKGRLQKNAAFWGIGLDCITIEHNLTKDAAASLPTDDDFALVEEVYGNKMHLMPVRTDDEVKRAATDLYIGRYSLPYTWRNKAATKILKRAQDLSIDKLDEQEYLEKAAGLGVVNPSSVAFMIRNRGYMHKDAAIKSRLKELLDLTNLGAFDQSEFTKMAEVIDITDRAGRLHKFYGRGLELPEEVGIGSTLTKMSEDAKDLFKLTSGCVLSKTDLAKVAADKLAALGNDLVEAVKGEEGNIDPDKAAAIFPTLPRDDALLVENSLGM